MTLAELRDQLLTEHTALRAAAHEALVEAQRLQAGPAAELDTLWARLRLLDALVLAHNRREEQLLAPVVRDLDAWGDVREALMHERHESEHASLLASLCECALADASGAAERAQTLIYQLLELMTREESELLSPEVLRDDLIDVDPEDG